MSLDAEFPKQVQDDSLAVVEALLAKGIAVGVVTSILGHMAKKDLTATGFPVEKFFLIQGSDDVPVHKPDPHVFDHALGLLKAKGIASNETLYVGDALMDFYAARDAGLVRRNCRLKQAAQKNVCVIYTLNV